MIRANAISLIVASMSKGSRSSSRSRRSKMHQNLRRRRRFTSSKKIRFSMGKQAKKSRSSSRSSSSKLSLSEGYLLAYCVACNQPVGWLALCPDSKFHTPRYMEFQKKSIKGCAFQRKGSREKETSQKNTSFSFFKETKIQKPNTRTCTMSWNYL
ncbi:NAD(P)H-quinone oxidoreductase subunit [Trichinella pseudospiralis]